MAQGVRTVGAGFKPALCAYHPRPPPPRHSDRRARGTSALRRLCAGRFLAYSRPVCTRRVPFTPPYRAVIPSVARNLPANRRPVCTRRAIPSGTRRATLDCFATLAMTTSVQCAKHAGTARSVQCAKRATGRLYARRFLRSARSYLARVGRNDGEGAGTSGMHKGRV
jgi:hypothetical protein